MQSSKGGSIQVNEDKHRTTIISIHSSSGSDGRDSDETTFQNRMPSPSFSISDHYNSESDPDFFSSSFLASTEDSAHSYDLYRIERSEVSKVVGDAAPDILAAHHAGRQHVARSSGVHEGCDLQLSETEMPPDLGMLAGESTKKHPNEDLRQIA